MRERTTWIYIFIRTRFLPITLYSADIEQLVEMLEIGFALTYCGGREFETHLIQFFLHFSSVLLIILRL